MNKNQRDAQALTDFLNSPEGARLAREQFEQEEKAKAASLEMAKSLGILCPGMTIKVDGKDFLVLGEADSKAGHGWFYAAPVLPEEARGQTQVADLKVIWHPETAVYAKTAAKDPLAETKRVLSLAQSIVG